MYLSTKQTIDTIIDRLNAGLEVIVTDGTVGRKANKAEIYLDVLSIEGNLIYCVSNNIHWCVEISTDDFDNNKYGITEIDGILYVAPQWWIDI